jgi:hypothetical protein
MTTPPHTKQQRKQDALDRLEHEVDEWVATADGQSGTPYLVPLSFLWDSAILLLSTPSSSPTSRNLLATGRVRIGIGPTRDLVLVEGPWRRRPPRGSLRLSAMPLRPRPASTRASSGLALANELKDRGTHARGAMGPPRSSVTGAPTGRPQRTARACASVMGLVTTLCVSLS